MLILVISLILLIFISAALGVWLLRSETTDIQFARFFIDNRGKATKGPNFLDRQAKRMRHIMPRLREAYRPFLEKQIIYANYQKVTSVEDIWGYKVALGTLGMLFGLYYSAGSPPIRRFAVVATFGSLLFFYHDYWIRKKATARQNELSRQVADMLDILATVLESGMGFSPAMVLVAKHLPAPLGDELQTVLAEQQLLGESRAVVYERLHARTTSPALHAFIDTLLQAEELGTSLADALYVRATNLRKRRVVDARQRIKSVNVHATLAITVGVLWAGLGFTLSVLMKSLSITLA